MSGENDYMGRDSRTETGASQRELGFGGNLRIFLMEVLATLGIIDLAYSCPHHLWPDFEGGWGTDELDFCSRYDGLL